jgi:hypothetical protein
MTNDYTIWLILAIVIIIILSFLHILTICLCINGKKEMDKDEKQALLN